MLGGDVGRVDKSALKAAILAAMERERDVLVAAQRATTEGVVHEDNRAEGDKDMRSTEASYLARGQAARVEALAIDLDRVRAMTLVAFDAGAPIAVSALVTIERGGARMRAFLAPAGGGMTVRCAGDDVQVITPRSPLGRALLGARAGDVVEVERGGEGVEHDVLSVE